ncbi:hypothetical protein [Cellulosilyticum sp. I15G10I2]|uniref:hypothetical protein n=1 Tax=Cellulosilyticum sp. I15G10I2 TaxID=1892843 RepID=UPI00085C279B|nr:hypothetical protein [Cellulosilyticum sp. I15G10I2]
MILFNKVYKDTYKEIPIPENLVKTTASKMNNLPTNNSCYSLYLKPIISLLMIVTLILSITLLNSFGNTKNNFVLMVYAAEIGSNDVQSVEITKEQGPPIILKNMFDFASWSNVSDYAEVYTDIQFTCVGENIDSITLSTTSGQFTEKVILTPEQIFVPQSKSCFKELGIVKSFYDSVRGGVGYIHLGESYTIAYDDQNLRQYGFKFDIPKSKAESTLDFSSFSNVITITATFKDGTELSKKVKLNCNGNEIFFTEK